MTSLSKPLSQRSQYSESPTCESSRLSASSPLSPFRSISLSRATPRGTNTTHTSSICASNPDSKISAASATQTWTPLSAISSRFSATSRRTAGHTMEVSWVIWAGSPNTTAPRAGRLIVPSAQKGKKATFVRRVNLGGVAEDDGSEGGAVYRAICGKKGETRRLGEACYLGGVADEVGSKGGATDRAVCTGKRTATLQAVLRERSRREQRLQGRAVCEIRRR